MSEGTFSDHYRVTGMTCDHCVRAVTAEVTALAGVTSVRLDLSDGELVLEADRQIERSLVVEAVEEAGYEVSS